jgi:uncharacterized OsmC-like protein
VPANSQAEARQRPLRALYRERPEQAVTAKWARTSSASVSAGDPFHGEVEIGRGYGVKMRFGLDGHVGGLHDLPNPGDLLCAAVAACEDGTLRMIAALLGVTVEELEVEVSGKLDVRGALAVSDDVRVGFELLSCRIRLRAAAGTDPRLLGRLVTAGERFCVNLDTLRNGVHVDIAADV